MERNALVFDISDPCDALNFAVFLFRLSRVYAPKLKRRVEEAREEILRNGGKIPEWTQEHQHPKKTAPAQPSIPGEQGSGSNTTEGEDSGVGEDEGGKGSDDEDEDREDSEDEDEENSGDEGKEDSEEDL